MKPKESWSCKVCGRPDPEIYMKIKGEYPDFNEYLPWSKKQVVEHIKKEHPEIAKESEKP